MKKIAINIDKKRNSTIKGKIIASLENLNLGYEVECFDKASDIFTYAPDIMMGHINDVNTSLLADPPSSLKWFHVMSAGVDEIINELGSSFCKHNIKLSNVKGIHSVAMREYVLSTMLYFEKNMAKWVEQKKNSEWSRSPLSCLAGKEILVYGVGSIGKEVGRIANFLGMHTVGISNSGKPVEGFEKVYQPSMLAQSVKSADYIVVTAPKTNATEGVFGKEVLSSFKSEAVLINVSRGELVDEQCLAECLNEGLIRGAALDVFCHEPLPHSSPLWQCQNLIITPHVSGYFSNGMALGVECFIDNLKMWCQTGELVNEVSIHKGY